MKKIVFVLAATVAIGACRAKTAPGYTVDGKIAGLSGKVYLSTFDGRQSVRIDSTEAAGGAFRFTGTCFPAMLTTVETADGPLARFFLENRKIRISAPVGESRRTVVSGSPATELYDRFEAGVDSIRLLLKNDSLIQAAPSTRDSLEKAELDLERRFVRENPGSAAAAYVLCRYLSYEMPADELDAAVDGLAPEIRQSPYAGIVRETADAMRHTAVGQPYADVAARDTAGRIVALSDIAGKGKYVLLDFWASWCPPCRAESPNLVIAYKLYGPKGFDIYAVSLDRDRNAWTKGIRNLGLAWHHVSELDLWRSEAAKTYAIRSIPSNVLIGPDGTILARNLTGGELQQKLAGLLGPADLTAPPSPADSRPAAAGAE